MDSTRGLSLGVQGGNEEESMRSQLKLYGHYACLSIGVFLLFVGSCLAIAVFIHIWGLVTTPENLAKSLTSVVKMVEADKFNIPLQGRDLPFGKFVALAVLMSLYYFCLRIPLTIVASGRELLKWTFASNENQAS